MEENRNQWKDIEEEVYVINKDYEIVYMDAGLKQIYPDSRYHELCHVVMRGEDKPCRDCPLHRYDPDTGPFNKQLLYNQKMGCWIDCSIIRLHWPNEGECMLFSIKRIAEDDHNHFLQFDSDVKYDEMMEFNAEKDTYDLLFYDRDKIRYPAKGTLSSFIQSICSQNVFQLDQDAFLKFWDTSTLMSRIEKSGSISQEFRISYHNEEYHWISFSINSVHKSHDQQTFICFTVNVDKHDTIKHKQAENQLFWILDSLTGLYNRATFQNKVRERLQEDSDYGIVCIDIEHFKLFNDWYGTEEGDKLLIYIATQIMKITKEHHGFGSRIGGDDFVMLLPRSCCDVLKIEKEIVSWMQNYQMEINFLPSGGVYLIEDPSMSVTLMCDRAQLALNSVKGNYTNRVALYNSSMKQKLENEQEVLFGVKKGLEQHEFMVYFQPQCSARTNKIIGAEALVRWNHPTKGILPPGEFVPILESCGFISKLDYYVWEEVCCFQHERLVKGQPVIPISVNVSRMDIYQYRIEDVFCQLIQKYELDPKMIEIEITESAYTEDFHHLINAVSKLREQGFIVLMDDFGSGYSSLNMLKDIEIDVLKIDMKFLEMGGYGALKSTGILESIIQMGKWLGLRMIAEGVETKEQMDNLLNLDCEYMQGYYFYKPLSLESFERLLEQESCVDTRGILAKRLPGINLDDLFHKDITSEGMLNNILGGIALYEVTNDEHIMISSVNDSYYRMTGCNSVDLYERRNRILNQVHPDDADIFWDILRKAETSSVLGASGVFRRYRLSGEVMWMHLHAFFLRKQGNKKIFYGAISDETQIMNLQKGRKRLLDTIAGNVVEVHVKDGKMISRQVVCAGLAEQHGYTKEEFKTLLESQEAINLIYEEDKKRVLDVMQQPATWGTHMNIEYRTVAKDGRILWQEQHINYVECEDGVDIYNQLSTDITLIKNQEIELMESQMTLQKILGLSSTCTSSIMMAKENRENAAFLFARSLPGGMIGGYCEPGFPIYFANEELIRLLGYDSYADLEMGIHGLVEYTIYEKDRSKVTEDLGDLFEGKEYTTQYRMVRKDGSLFWVIDKGRVVKAEDGRLAIISSCMDIDETMNAKLKLEEAREDMTLLNSLVPGGYHQCYLTPGYEFKHISTRFLDMLGFTMEDIEQRFDNKYINMVVPEDRGVFANIMLTNIDSVFNEQYRMYTSTGTIWVRDQTRLILQENGSYFAGIIEDISDVVMMQDRVKAIISNTPGDVFSIEHDTMIYHSYNLASTMGYSLQEYKKLITESNGSCFSDPRDRPMIREIIRIAKRDQTDVDIVFRSVARNQETRFIHMKATCSKTSDGSLIYYGIMVDASASIEKEQELRISQQMFDSIIRQAKLDVWEYDLKKDRLMLSKEGWSQISETIPSFIKENNGMYIFDSFCVHMNHVKRLLPKTYHVLSYMREKIEHQDFNEAIIDLSGYQKQNQWIKVTCQGIYDNQQHLVKVIGYFQNVTHEIEKEVIALEEKKYAQFDSLTGIYNRRMGEILIQNALSQKKEEETSALLMIDLDDFKQVNDRYGHIKGDHVLKAVAAAIQENLDQEDIFCRLGGDEFLIYTTYQKLSELEKKLSVITESIQVTKRCVHHLDTSISLSIGAALAPQHGIDLHTLYEKADQALYYVKSSGKNQYHIYKEND